MTHHFRSTSRLGVKPKLSVTLPGFDDPPNSSGGSSGISEFGGVGVGTGGAGGAGGGRCSSLPCASYLSAQSCASYYYSLSKRCTIG